MIKTPAQYLKIKRNYIRTILIQARGGKCQICGYCKSYQALEFHHRDPKTKKIKLSGINLTTYPWSFLIVELAKCDLLCANCHAEKKQT